MGTNAVQRMFPTGCMAQDALSGGRVGERLYGPGCVVRGSSGRRFRRPNEKKAGWQSAGNPCVACWSHIRGVNDKTEAVYSTVDVK